MFENFWKDFLFVVMGFFALCMIVVAVVSLTVDAKKEKKEIPTITFIYDCRIAEISVDYPLTVKELCREKMSK